jgi:hypothetical protein
MSREAALPPPAATPAPRDGWAVALGALALLNAANAVWMLAAPEHWYHELPANVPAAGPFNAHFVRDIGCAFLVVAAAYGWAALRPAHRVPLVSLAALFLVAHAALHVIDSARGYLPAGHWHDDLALVYLPAVLSLVITAALWRRRDARA